MYTSLSKRMRQELLQNPIKALKTCKCYELAVDYANDPYCNKTDSSYERNLIPGNAAKSR